MGVASLIGASLVKLAVVKAHSNSDEFVGPKSKVNLSSSMEDEIGEIEINLRAKDLILHPVV